jgi:hypothetical protein
MKRTLTAVVAFGLGLAACAAPAEGTEPEGGWKFSAGADLRIRHEMMDNLPGNPGDPYSLTPGLRTKNRNQMRFRPRVFMELQKGPFKLYTRLADEFREYPAGNSAPRAKRAYTFPDEIFLDNLYLEGTGLEADGLHALGVETFDFRVGRQDLFVGGHSVFGLDRLLAEGTPTDGSRSFYTDMLRATLHFDEVRKLDLFALYCNGRNNLRWGNRQSRGRTLNCINLADSNDLDEWGGGAILSDAAFDGHLPFKLYSIFKRSEAHRIGTAVPKDLPAKEVTTLGFLLTPEFDEHWSMEIEAAKQFGRLLDGNRQAGGWMTHLELKYRPDVLRSWKPVVSLASTCYSGDRHRTGPGDNDTAWDPMWARYTLDSEMLVYGSLYGNCYWTNVTYTKLKLAMTFGERHAMYAYTGPMFTAAQDHLGHADGGGDSMYKGWLTAARYDFPIRLAPKGAAGLDRFEVFAHVVAEHFAPGDYFDSSKSAYFARWEIDVRF